MNLPQLETTTNVEFMRTKGLGENLFKHMCSRVFFSPNELKLKMMMSLLCLFMFYVSCKTGRAVCFVFDKPFHFIFTGATSAPCLIFIFPAVFYIRIVPKEDEPMSSTPKILVRHSNLSWTIHYIICLSDFVLQAQTIVEVLIIKPLMFFPLFLGCLFCCLGRLLHGNESELHNNRPDNGEQQRRWRPLDPASVCVGLGKWGGGKNWSM